MGCSPRKERVGIQMHEDDQVPVARIQAFLHSALSPILGTWLMWPSCLSAYSMSTLREQGSLRRVCENAQMDSPQAQDGQTVNWF